MRSPFPKIVAPAASIEQVRRLCDAGADELYVGALVGEWIAHFSDADFLSRRQGSSAHFTDWDDLERALRLAQGRHRRLSLVLNQRYTPVQELHVLTIAQQWESIGGEALIVADPGLMWTLRQNGYGGRIHVSLMANTFNASTAAFFRELGAARIILPRELSVGEMRSLVAEGPEDVEYEAMALHQRCPFNDGTCGFYHATRIDTKLPTLFSYRREGAGPTPTVRSLDPIYEGHGCQLPWTCASGAVGLPGYAQGPACAACRLSDLAESGIGYLKIGGRSYSSDMLETSIQFLRRCLQTLDGTRERAPVIAAIKDHYASAFGAACTGDLCYYPETN